MLKYLAISGLALSLFGVSQPALSAAGDYDVLICAVQAMTINNTAYISRCSNRVSQNGCSNAEWIVWDMSQGDGRGMYSAALTSLLAGKTVTVRFDGSTCNGGYDVTTMLRIRK